MMTTCYYCGTEHSRPQGKRYCPSCHAAYMREWRKTHKPDRIARFKSSARAMANVYLRRGKIERKPCLACGNPDSEMHHEDYSQPLAVIWLCRPCHLRLHKAD